MILRSKGQVDQSLKCKIRLERINSLLLLVEHGEKYKRGSEKTKERKC